WLQSPVCCCAVACAHRALTSLPTRRSSDLRTELGVEAVMGKPKVSFREAFGGPVELVFTHKKQSGGSGQFAEVKMVFEPGEPGRSEEHTSELQSRVNLVCRLLLENKNTIKS